MGLDWIKIAVILAVLVVTFNAFFIIAYTINAKRAKKEKKRTNSTIDSVVKEIEDAQRQIAKEINKFSPK